MTTPYWNGNGLSNIRLDICLTGATEGEIGRLVAAGQIDKADAVLDKYHAVFADQVCRVDSCWIIW